MKTEQFSSWLTRWLTRHPLKSPPDDSSYAPQVMARIQSVSDARPAPVLHVVWSRWPAWALSSGAVLAAAAVVLLAPRQAPVQVADAPADLSVQQAAAVLARLGEDLNGMVEAAPDELAEELAAIDRIMLVEAPESKGALESLWEEMELLNQLGVDEPQPEPAGTDSEDEMDELLQELEWMDGADAASS